MKFVVMDGPYFGFRVASWCSLTTRSKEQLSGGRSGDGMVVKSSQVTKNQNFQRREVRQMNKTLVVAEGSVKAQKAQITAWLDNHLQRAQYDSDYLTIRLNGTTYRIFNIESAIEQFKKCCRRLGRKPQARTPIPKKYANVQRLRPQGVKFWTKEIAELQNPKPNSEYKKVSEEDRAKLIAMAAKNIETIQNQERESK
jgi:hypothetical protein